MIGVWLVQLGTPQSPSVSDVRTYLREFLMDARMIDLPYPARWVLVNGIIATFRAPKSAEAYQSIWTKDGSPLMFYSQRIKNSLQEALGSNYFVELGMRYGSPSIQESWDRLKQKDLKKIVALPLFPQYASSSNGSAIEKIFEVVGKEINIPTMNVISNFYDHPGFIKAFVDRAKEYNLDEYDNYVFSYHGLPEKYVKQSGRNCLTQDCCARISSANQFCYRAHCYETTRLLRSALRLPAEKTHISFQSRLGPTKWIEPYTDKIVPELAKKGSRKLLVFSPSFVADCLETLEEIQIRLQEDYLAAGGQTLQLVASLNDSQAWVDGIIEILRPYLEGTGETTIGEVVSH